MKTPIHVEPPKRRCGIAVAALRRRAGKLAHRLKPRGGARQAARRELARERAS